jgi:hypothetical protein
MQHARAPVLRSLGERVWWKAMATEPDLAALTTRHTRLSRALAQAGVVDGDRILALSTVLDFLDDARESLRSAEVLLDEIEGQRVTA